MTATETAAAGWVVGRRKAIIERLAAVTLLVPSTLAMIPIMLWSAVSFRANPIFRQRRPGSRGELFEIMKLRTLPITISTDLDRGQLQQEHQMGGFAKLLRATHLDELPQIWHVVSGKMSLVGPRPLPEPLADDLDSDFRRLRELARPGLTGLWQISVCGAERFEKYEPLDVAYVQTATPRLDAKILYWTMRQVVTGKRLTAEEIEASMGVAIGAFLGPERVLNEETAFEAVLHRV